MPDDPLTVRVARHCNALQLDRIPPEVIDAAKLHILDSIGCLLAGTRLGPGKLAYELAATASGFSNSSSTLFGTAQRVSYLEAVQAMSVAAHCGEMDDIHTGAGLCIGAMIVPALLAMAEKYSGGGRRFLEAAIVGYETVIRVGLSIDTPALFARGWWPSTVCGAFGVAAAGAKFLSWSAEPTANALGIAALHSGGMITGGSEGATARHLSFGHAAQNGVRSLLAADQGFTGPKRAFEDPRGFCLTLCQEPKWEHLQSFGSFHLPQVALKPYPCARQLHAGVEALLRVLQQQRLTPQRIDAIELAVPTANASMVDRPSITASHAATVGSGQYVMAVTALRGKIDLASFDVEFLTSGAVHDLTQKVKIIAGSELDRHFPKYWAGRVTVKSGSEVYSEEVIIPKGESGNPMRRDEVEEKFMSLAAPVIGNEKTRSVVQEVESLDSRNSSKALLALLKVAD
jgi:2-methylcitrate dehydratase PrpD